METCANCGRTIGNLETPRIFGEEVVCAGCWKTLWEQTETAAIETPPPLIDLHEQISTELLAYESKADTRKRMAGAKQSKKVESLARACPVCGSSAAPKRRRKGSYFVFAFLLLFGVLPGLIYAIVYEGYTWTCSKCGAKIADVP
jgi:hypothetical protein